MTDHYNKKPQPKVSNYFNQTIRFEDLTRKTSIDLKEFRYLNILKTNYHLSLSTVLRFLDQLLEF